VFECKGLNSLSRLNLSPSVRVKVEIVHRQMRLFSRISRLFLENTHSLGFLYADALAAIKAKLLRSTTPLRTEKQNCIEVLRLHAACLSTIEGDGKGAERHELIAESLEKGAIRKADRELLRVCERLPCLS